MARKSVSNSASSRSLKARKGGSPVPRTKKPKPALSDRRASQKQPSPEAIAILAVQLETLATLRDPRTAASKKPGTFIRKAAKLIETVPYLLTPQFEELSTEEMHATLESQIQRRQDEDLYWERDLPPFCTYEEAISQLRTRFTSAKRLHDFMRRHDYPPRYRDINQAGYEIAVKKERTAKQESDRVRKQEVRAKNARKANSPKSPSKSLQKRNKRFLQ